ncbi:hypothetical protein [Geminocystis sp. GBBB08]|uniref:hypothetical protein n=1 Tax=Geminocystis sp. GBBB08 TaxID=2604140 RepID=UPI0027E2C017|nr:hypothetical protein [Geminocystis sp. GBBB08]MBL1209744.1 hypothetical protein [Geminocystis sp. GBBB08]
MFHRTVLGFFTLLLGWQIPVLAETCTPILVVGGEGSTVTKTVSEPTIPTLFGVDITRNNWNTDWAVPTEDNTFRRYLVEVSSNDGGPFDLKMYLKYSDQTADLFFNKEGLNISKDKPLKIESSPRPEAQPYQVNLFVGGIESLGKTYTATVMGCR